jgi:two-component system NtrC family sensor kinase
VRVSPLRTISGRIALGFFVLLATFAAVSGYTILKLGQLGSDLQFVRTAYLEVSLAVAQLNSLQSGMVDQLDGKAPLPRPFVNYSQQIRMKLLDQSIAQIRNLEGVPQSKRNEVLAIERQLVRLARRYRENGPLFEIAFSPQAAPEAKAAAVADLSRREHHISSEINSWFHQLKTSTIAITLELEEVERQASLGAIYLGVVGALLGVLVFVWSVLTLRPLARLHDGVRSVAAGNYRQRVAVSGGTEVADLAREFNAMAQAIQERESELVRSERLAVVGKMAAVITHEVRNPLSSIGLNAELLEEELAASGSKEAVGLCRAIAKEVDRLTAITEEYLRFARLPRPRLEREQLNSIVAGVVEFQREDLASRGVEIEARLAEALPAVAADEAQLRQALLNLLRNAADAMTGAAARTLTVATRRADDGAVEVSVKDTGSGIPAEDLPRIFDPFFSTKDRGTGLGLALTHQIVAEHGGRIEVDTTPGRGTTFTLKLPAAA